MYINSSALSPDQAAEYQAVIQELLSRIPKVWMKALPPGVSIVCITDSVQDVVFKKETIEDGMITVVVSPTDDPVLVTRPCLNAIALLIIKQPNVRHIATELIKCMIVPLNLSIKEKESVLGEIFLETLFITAFMAYIVPPTDDSEIRLDDEFGKLFAEKMTKMMSVYQERI